MAQPIEFYFDFSSPYGYIASQLIDSVAATHGREVVWKPLLLGAVFKITGMAPLLEYPVKGDYMRRDFERSARLHGIPYRMPDPFPFSGVTANRAFYWLEASDPARAHDLARAFFDAAFVKGRNISVAEQVADIAVELGIEPEALLAGIQSPEVKDRTRAENDSALAKGVFGSPYFLVDGEPFWGADRLDQVERWLVTGGW
jgi:2-hydroxychromene-2-carboxylate isomerase